jgi:peptide/nickel transport system ATP-binding protein
LLDVENLQIQFRTPSGVLRAVEGLSFQVHANETVAIVGESGCGKSVTSLAIMRLISGNHGRVAGAIRFNGVDLVQLGEKQMRSIRGNDISMIFQEPMSSLNPVLKVGRQIAENVRLHQAVNRRTALRRAIDMIELVGIPDAKRRAGEYPHQLSGGMRQRVMIAMALACNPKLLIADEPTTALDVTIQAQILQLMRDLRSRIGTSIIIITHDLGVVADLAQRVIVMYAGRKVEEGSVDQILSNPLHPYTRGLLKAIPRIEAVDRDIGPLAEIPGSVPDLRERIDFCAFAARCPSASEVCHSNIPAFSEHGPGHFAACFKVGTAFTARPI